MTFLTSMEVQGEQGEIIENNLHKDLLKLMKDSD